MELSPPRAAIAFQELQLLAFTNTAHKIAMYELFKEAKTDPNNEQDKEISEVTKQM